MRINKTLRQILLVVVGLAMMSACQSGGSKTGASASGGGATPTEAYKNLYAAVKSKNTDNIKACMSKATIDFVEKMAAPMQHKQPAEVYSNGLIQANLSNNLPPLRNERMKGNMGAVEVQNPDGSWQDVPFVLEDDRWKLAVGDEFKGSYQKPAPSQAETEANNNVPQIVPGMPANANVNMNANFNSLMNKKPEKTTEKPMTQGKTEKK